MKFQYSTRPLGDMFDEITRAMPSVPTLEEQATARKLFFAGAIAMKCLMEVVGDDDVPAEQGALILEMIGEECREFYDDVIGEVES